jgi:hypothetical protein
MSQMQQGRTAGDPALRRRRLGSVSRRAVGYFVDPGEPDSVFDAEPDRRGEDTAEFAPEVPVVHTATVVLPLTRSGGYEREPVDQRLAELEHELAAVRGMAATPTGVEAEIQYLGEETAEILRVAHQKAEALVTRATDEAEALRATALADAAAVKAAAEDRLRQLDAETELIWAERTRLTDDTRRLSEALRSIADSAVERFPAADPAGPPVLAVGPCLDEPAAD